MIDRNETSEDLDIVAGEYVIGLGDEAHRHAIDQRLASDAELRAAVARARERFHELDLTAPVASTSPQMWQSIEAGIGEELGNVADFDSARSASRPSQATGPQTAARPDPSQRRTASTRGAFWRGAMAASIAGAIAVGLAYTWVKPPSPNLIVVLLDAEAQPVSIVEALPGQRVRVVPLGPIAVPEGKTLQVWTLPDAQTGPVSIGLLAAQTAETLQGPSLPPPKADQLYEITIEPAGGSPTGKPTGPIVGKGFARIPQI